MGSRRPTDEHLASLVYGIQVLSGRSAGGRGARVGGVRLTLARPPPTSDVTGDVRPACRLERGGGSGFTNKGLPAQDLIHVLDRWVRVTGLGFRGLVRA